MRWVSALGAAVAALTSLAPLIPGAAAVYQDPDTGFTFSEYSVDWAIGKSMTFRIAIPSPATTGFDTVLQVVAPNDIGWSGLCWGGTMLNNPLAISWASGSSAMISSRATSTRSLPAAYSGATYQVFTTGTKSNGTHWQITAKCAGCTSFNGTNLNPAGANRLAWAASGTKPSSPSSNTSSFAVHDSYNYWSHDFSTAGNTNFDALVAQNS